MIALNRRYSYEDIFQGMEELSRQYPDFTVCRSIGTSHDGRDIPMMRVGLGKKTLVLTAGIHGRESVPAALYMVYSSPMELHRFILASLIPPLRRVRVDFNSFCFSFS